MGRYQTAEEGVRCEDMAYNQLHFMQGALIPWYFGAHKFTLPNGHEIYGVIMEYVSGTSLGSKDMNALTAQQQVQLVRSADLAVRALEHADVSQHDWHGQQILVKNHHSGTHCVFIDFAAASTSLHVADMHRTDDYGQVLDILTHNPLLDAELAFDSYGERRCWDDFGIILKINGKTLTRFTQEPYQYVWDTKEQANE
ncbi:hypothetical protein OE88DRAFT_1368248 [Heliocybe sulcata]|uniref:Protein kinase domain-containing protein n=1 Tax=Heliocybe sulcata TaxID=5364 RepID=A0A5C3N5P9_9AGAM|nr:hypothetical protein OE88DRAFT_1368248 [Heliocybe sulcata]